MIHDKTLAVRKYLIVKLSVSRTNTDQTENFKFNSQCSTIEKPPQQ